MKIAKLLKGDSGAALIMAILFTLILNGIAFTLFATSSEEISSSASQVGSQDTFNVAEAALNIGLLRIKAIMEANAPIDPSVPFALAPFNLASEGGVSDDTLSVDDYKYFDLVNVAELGATFAALIQSDYTDDTLQAFTNPIDGFFVPETSNPELFRTHLTGAEPVYNAIIDNGDKTMLRGWRMYLQNNNDKDDKTALLVAVGYLIDPQNDLLFQKKIELTVYIHGQEIGKNPDPTGQVTSSGSGSKTGKFRVTSDLENPVNTYGLR